MSYIVVTSGVDAYGYELGYGLHYESMYILDGGVAEFNYVGYGGTQTVMDNGRAEDATVEDGGIQVVESAGTAVRTTVREAGEVFVDAGGQLLDLKQSGGMVYASGGVVSGGSMTGGELFSLAGGAVSALSCSGRAELWIGYNGGGGAYGVALAGGARMVVREYGSAYATVVASGGILEVLGQGSSYDAVVSGTASVASGGLFSGGLVASGGILTAGVGAVLGGAIAVNGTLNLTGNAVTAGATVTLDLTGRDTSAAALVAGGAYFAGSLNVSGTAQLAAGSYALLAGAGSGRQTVGYSEARSADWAGASFQWLEASGRYSGVADGDYRLTLTVSGSDVRLLKHQRYVLPGNPSYGYIADDASYLDKREGAAADSYYCILNADYTYAGVVYGGRSAGGIGGDIEIRIDGAALGHIFYGGGIDGDQGGSITVTVEAGSSAARLFNAGGLTMSGDHVTGGSINLVIHGGSFANSVSAGSRVSGGWQHTVEGGVNVTVTGGVFHREYSFHAAGYVQSAGSLLLVKGGVTASVGGVSLSGTSSNVRGFMFGGFASDGGAIVVEGGVSATLNDGVYNSVFGGGWCQGEGSTIQVRAGDAGYAVDLVVNGGSFHWLYGGGTHATSGKAGGDSTVSGDIRITVNGGSFSRISGGGQFSNDAVDGDVEIVLTDRINANNTAIAALYGDLGNSVSGTKTLTFAGFSATLAATLGSFDQFRFTGDAAAAVTCGDLSWVNTWSFDLKERAGGLADTACLEWSGTNDFSGDTLNLDLSGVIGGDVSGWTLMADGAGGGASFANLAGAAIRLYIDGVYDRDLTLEAAISGGVYDGWGLTLADNTLRFGLLS